MAELAGVWLFFRRGESCDCGQLPVGRLVNSTIGFVHLAVLAKNLRLAGFSCRVVDRKCSFMGITRKGWFRVTVGVGWRSPSHATLLRATSHN